MSLIFSKRFLSARTSKLSKTKTVAAKYFYSRISVYFSTRWIHGVSIVSFVNSTSVSLSPLFHSKILLRWSILFIADGKHRMPSGSTEVVGCPVGTISRFMALHKGLFEFHQDWNKPVASVYIRSELSRKFFNTAVRCGDAFIGSRAVGTCIQVSFLSTITRLRGSCRNSYPAFSLSLSATCYFSYFNFHVVPLCAMICAVFKNI